MGKVSATAKAESLATMREVLKPGDTVFTIVRSVASSGMSRTISPIIFLDNDVNQARYYTYHIGRILGLTQVNAMGNDALRIGGCGMDMCAHLVDCLSYELFPNGFDCLGENCPASAHHNSRGQNCPVCNVELGREHWADAVDIPADSQRAMYLGRSGPDGWVPQPWDAHTPRYKRPGERIVCSEACATVVWHHNSGANALRQKSL